MTFPSVELLHPGLLIVTFTLLLLGVRRPVYAVIGYFLILNAQIGGMYPLLGAIRFELLAAIFVFLCIFVFGSALPDKLPKESTLHKAVLIFLVVGMASFIQAVDLRVSWEYGGYFLLKVFLLYIMIVCSCHDDNDLKRLLWGVVLVSCWIAYEPISNYFLGRAAVHEYGSVAVGRFGAAQGHVALANTLSQMIPIIVFWTFGERKTLVRHLLYLILVFLCIGIVVSKARGGFIAILATGFAMIYFSKTKVKTLLWIAFALTFLLILAGDEYFARISTITDGIHASRSSADRLSGLVHGISMMLKRPLLGVGIGCYAAARSMYFGYYFYAHNLYGELLGELGLGSIAWFYMVYLVFTTAHKLNSSLDDDGENGLFYSNLLKGIQVATFVRLVIGLFSHSALAWFWFVAAGLMVGFEKVLARPPRHELLESATPYNE